jgi:hypothetical protein
VVQLTCYKIQNLTLRKPIAACALFGCWLADASKIIIYFPIWLPITPPTAAPPTVPSTPPPVNTAPPTAPTPAPMAVLLSREDMPAQPVKLIKKVVNTIVLETLFKFVMVHLRSLLKYN